MNMRELKEFFKQHELDDDYEFEIEVNSGEYRSSLNLYDAEVNKNTKSIVFKC